MIDNFYIVQYTEHIFYIRDIIIRMINDSLQLLLPL